MTVSETIHMLTDSEDEFLDSAGVSDPDYEYRPTLIVLFQIVMLIQNNYKYLLAVMTVHMILKEGMVVVFLLQQASINYGQTQMTILNAEHLFQ
jgi:hypothetical protein